MPAKMPVTTFSRRATLLTVLLAAMGAVHAQPGDYPNRPIRLIVAWPAGGGGDLVGRVMADRLGQLLGQPVIVDNRAGASGTIGTQAAARSPADGYTLLLGQANNNVIAPAVFKVAYDTVQDFTPITYIGYAPNILVVHPQFPVNSVPELIAAARKAGDFTFSSAGYGTIQNISGAQFSRLAGAPFTHVPYKGSSAALTDLLAGRVTMSFETMPSVLPSVLGGKLKALAVSTPQRVPALPNVPTYAEAGLSEVKLTNWYSLMAPQGVSADIVTKLDKAMKTALADPEVRRKLDSQGMVYGGPTTPAGFGKFVEEEAQRYRTLARELDIKGE